MMDKKLFDDAIGEVPASTVDLDAAIARGRRAARVRMVVNPTAGVAAGVLVVVGAVAFALLPDRQTTPPAVTSSPPPTTSSESPCDAADEAIPRLSDLARELVGDRLPPGARLVSDVPDEDPLQFFPSINQGPPDDCGPDKIVEYTGLANISLDGKTGLLAISVSTDKKSPLPCVVDGVKLTALPVCEQRTGPGGERIQLRTEVYSGGSPVHNVVTADKPDGTSISITVGNNTIIAPGEPMAAPPLSLDQAVEIALDEGMTLFP